ncbi:YgfZ/GcvT domain-containing protein [Polynucleobacter necessarius]|uniref:CAF17-like 4Fe-4S cluster assembly/insertion protein YgfZ n=1 Tax=Polynucleobacter necessarius TaxID=576610 RepID=UPI000E099B38|nr:folate-binding protein YgfZ [Polynucleobacter necessarius]HAT39926.1 folate-binding protein [Polynucleobacter sp.]
MTNISKIQFNPLDTPSSFPCKLTQWGLILVEGPDAARFLQNQLTNSILGLSRTLPGQIAHGFSAARLVGYCSHKGRLLASAWIGLFTPSIEADDHFFLFVSKDLATSTAKRLSMFVLRSKVKATNLSDQWMISGFYGSESRITEYALDASSFALRMPDVLANNQSIARLLIASPTSTAMDCEGSNNEKLASFNLLEVLSAIPRIVQATQEKFVPQMINFESVAGVDFKKGCYPGQEIVARSQYRGAIKRRLQLAHLLSEEIDESPFMPGVAIFHSNDESQPAGMVVLSARDPHESKCVHLQIECKLEALESGEIRLASPNGPVLTIDPLPYSLIEI